MVTCKWYQALWGLTGDLEPWLKQIKAEGYEGVEGNLDEVKDDAVMRAMMADNGLIYSPMVKTEGPDHFDAFRRKCERVLQYNPTYINSHSGQDFMSLDEQDEFFGKVVEFEKQLPVPVFHETHRTRPMFTPFNTLRILEKFPDLKLTADFSHWCNVCESLLGDQKETMAKIIPHVGHLHIRVGYAEGPQAPDPAAPEYAEALAVHEEWWKEVLRLHDGGSITVVPEYGPAFSRYLHTLPWTDVPVADMLAVRRWARARFEEMCKEI